MNLEENKLLKNFVKYLILIGCNKYMKEKKVVLFSKIMNIFGLVNLFFYFQKLKYKIKYIRAINYHGTPKKYQYNFENQLIFFKKNYSTVSLVDLENLLNGKWIKEKPGLIISFDDGLKSNYDVAMPLLEKYGFIGWFFIPVGLIGTGNCKLQDNTSNNDCGYMTWGNVIELSKRHIIGCHTLTHCRLFSNISEDKLESEIINSKKILEKKLKKKNKIFCWVGGEENTYTAKASKYIQKAGYKYSFMTNNELISYNTDRFHLQRTNIEADWSLHLVKFYLSGIIDIIYTKKRNRINKLTR